MKILFVNQFAYPDAAATSQHLSDLAADFSRRGHEVTILTGRWPYDAALHSYPPVASWGTVKLMRISYYRTSKKQAKISRFLSALTFHFNLFFKFLLMDRPDLIVALTSPPFLSTTALFLARIKHSKFVYWVLDINPDQAIAAGWLKEESIAAKFALKVHQWTVLQSDGIITLDEFMADRLKRNGAIAHKMAIIPPWMHDEVQSLDEGVENPFRTEHHFNGKFVVMYSGNHSICHPLETILKASRAYECDPDLAFCFIGGGARAHEVSAFIQANHAKNIFQLPYQPRERLGESLAAADLHLVSMGDAYTGMIHPSKIYGILGTGRPFIFIGPTESHIGKLIREHALGFRVDHGDVQGLLYAIKKIRSWTEVERKRYSAESLSLSREFSRAKATERMIQWIEKI